MAHIEIRGFNDRDIGDCAVLLAARHGRDRGRSPVVARRFEDAALCREMIASMQGPLLDGVVAEVGGRVVGFLLGERQLHPPRGYFSYFFEPYSTAIPLHGHAVAAEVDAVAVTRALYGKLAEAWVRRGFFIHAVRIIAGDAELQEAWSSLGFGRKVTCAVRPTADPVTHRPATGVEIRQVGPSDLEVVTRLVHVNGVHHAQSPLYWPYLLETVDDSHATVAHLLDDPANAAFVAYRDGRPVGLQNFMAPLFVSPMLVPGHMVYLFHGVVEAEARGSGIGTALLAHSMAWARAQGHVHCALHFGSPNLSAASFWPRQGFVAVEHTLSRHVDERIVWASGRE